MYDLDKMLQAPRWQDEQDFASKVKIFTGLGWHRIVRLMGLLHNRLEGGQISVDEADYLLQFALDTVAVTITLN